MKPTFTAIVTILNLSHQPDDRGLIVPPEAYITYPKSIPITYGTTDVESVVGRATIYKSGDQFIANMILFSIHKDLSKSERLIRKLYPAVGLEVFEQVGQALFKCNITELFLTKYKNDDKTIKALGDTLIKIPQGRH